MNGIIKNIYELPFHYLQPPNISLIRPRWAQLPSSMTVFGIVLFSYFLVCGGLIYDMIIEPTAVGSTMDSKGVLKPIAFMSNRINGQYIVEGLVASLFFILGSIGFIFLERSHYFNQDEFFYKRSNISHSLSNTLSFPSSKLSYPEPNIFLTTIAFMLIMISFALCWLFMLTKHPGYLQ